MQIPSFSFVNNLTSLFDQVLWREQTKLSWKKNFKEKYGKVQFLWRKKYAHGRKNS